MISWYALHVRSNCEGLVAGALDSAGLENYFPAGRAESGDGRSTPRAGSIVRIDERRRPLFPGYVFGRFDWENERRKVVSIPQVVRILGIGWLPIAIEDSEIQSVRMIAESPVPMHAHPFLTSGERVRVRYGPLVGVEGIVSHVKRSTRIVVSVSIIGRSMAAKVDADQLEAIGGTGGNGDASSRLAA